MNAYMMPGFNGNGYPGLGYGAVPGHPEGPRGHATVPGLPPTRQSPMVHFGKLHVMFFFLIVSNQVIVVFTFSTADNHVFFCELKYYHEFFSYQLE